MREILLYFSIKYLGDWNKIYKALEDKEDVDYELVTKYAVSNTDRFITILDNDYPVQLKGIEM
jgi:DNA processing protein